MPSARRRPLQLTSTLLLALGMGMPAMAEVLVSNMGQTSGDRSSLNAEDMAQAFTTGDNAAGYTITGVEVVFTRISADVTYGVGIWSSDEEVDAAADSDTHDEPHASVGTLTCPTLTPTTVDTVVECTASGIGLAANTTYVWVIDSSDDNTLNSLLRAFPGTEDAGAASGWSIADRSLFRGLDTTGGWTSWPRPMHLRINGTLNTSVLTSNIDEATESGVSGTTSNIGQLFHVGDNTAGYTITAISVGTDDAEGHGFDIKVCTADDSANEYPTTDCTDFTAPSAFAAGNITFTHTGMPVAPSTNYVIVADPRGTDTVDFAYTASGSQSGETDWSIKNKHYFLSGSNWGTTGQGIRALQVAIRGRTRSNAAATGKPEISGTATVGQTLTASKGTVADANGMPDTVAYQWIRFDGGDMDIPGADSSTYTLVVADEGKQVKVTVSFTDNLGYAESRTSDAYPSGGTVEAQETAGSSSALVSNMEQTSADRESLNDNDIAQAFTTGDNTAGYTITGVEVVFSRISANSDYTVGIWSSDEEVDAAADSDTLDEPHASVGTLTCPTLTPSDVDTVVECTTSGLGLEADTTYVWVIDSDNDVTLNSLQRAFPGTEDPGAASGWSIADNSLFRNLDTTGGWTSWPRPMYLRINGISNNTAATGKPEIGGAAGVGHTLTAARGTLADVEGVPNTFAYQWIRVDNGDTNIPGADASTYTLVAADEGKQVKVKVSFTDNAGNAESRTSDAYPSEGTIRPEGTTAASNALVSNIGQPDGEVDTSVGVDLVDVAQAFTTGDNATGYTLTSVEVVFAKIAADTHYDVGIWSSDEEVGASSDTDSLHEPHARLGTLACPTLPQSNVKIVVQCVAPEIDLEANTTYVWVMDGSDNVTVNTILGAVTGAEDPNGASNWSIADGGLTRGLQETGGWTNWPRPIRIRVNGRTNPALPSILTSVLTSNLDETTESGTSGTTANIGQLFHVGDNTGGYTITDIVVESDDAQGHGFDVKVCTAEDSANEYPTTDCTDFSAPSAFAAGNITFTHTGMPVAPSTNYVIVADPRGTDTVDFAYTASGSQSGETDWSIKNQHYVNSGGGWGTTTSSTRALKVAIQGRTRHNTPASGQPEISGQAIAGETLTASKDTIIDIDGIPDTVSYQWIRVDNGDTDIPGETRSTYALTSADVGKQVRVRVSFNDIIGHAESRTSDRYPQGRTIEDSADARDPSAVRSLVAHERNTEVTLEWAEPIDNGSRAITGYEVRHAQRTTVPPSTPWTDVGLTLEHTVTGLVNERQYTFEVRAVNAANRRGAVAQVQATPEDKAPSRPLHLRALYEDNSNILFLWSKPSRDGGTAISHYEYRYAQGTSVPTDTPWTRSSQSPYDDVNGFELRNLVNGRTYTFEVRAVAAIPGSVARVQATPTAAPVHSVPSAPRNLRASFGEPYPHVGQAVVDATLRWDPATNEGNHGDNTNQDTYQVRHAEGSSVPEGTPWGNTGQYLGSGAIGLKANTIYTFEVRYRNALGKGDAARLRVRTPAWSGPTMHLYTEGTVREGEPFTLGVRRTGDASKAAYAVVELEDSAFPNRVRHAVVELAANATTGTTTFTPALDGARPARRTLSLILADVSEGVVIGTGARENPLMRTVAENDAGLRVMDAIVREAANAVLRFEVRLDRTRRTEVTVDYATADDSATQGQDYTAASGTLRIAPGERRASIEVEVLDDGHDEGTETLTLTLSNARGAILDRATATGRITNDDPMPQAWIARFGRTVGEQALEAIEHRFETPRRDGFTGRFAGVQLAGPGMREADATPESDGTHALETFTGRLAGDARDPASRTPSARELLAGSSFALTMGTAETGTASFWGRGAVSAFEGRDGAVSLDGEVASAMLGAELAHDGLIAGVMLAHSRGTGGYRASGTARGAGELASTVTGLYPYARGTLSERVSAWAMAGYGEGTLTLTPEGQAPMRPGLDLVLGAVGVRAVLVDGEGLTLSAKSDAFGVRTSTEAVAGLAAARGDATRLRLALEGSRALRFGAEAQLTPSVELGVRHDGGDAETGFGTDIGAGLVLAAPARGLSADIRARGLLTHEADGFSEWGVAGTLAFDPAPSSEWGPSLSLRHSVGAEAQGGAEALLDRRTLAGLEAGGNAPARTEARLGYGLPVFAHRLTAVPEVSVALSDGERTLRIGGRLAWTAGGLPFELGVEAARREEDASAPAHDLEVGLRWRVPWGLAMHLEAQRPDRADARVGFGVTARW